LSIQPVSAIVRRLWGKIHVPIEAGGIALTDREKLAWLRLIRSDNVGPAGIMAQTPQERNPARS
jgi:hypothetical protein